MSLFPLGACASQADEGSLNGLAFEVTPLIGTDTDRDVEYLEFTTVITNESGTPKDLEYGGCALNVTAYPTAARTGEPVWDGERISDTICAAALFRKTLEPGERWMNPVFTERYDLTTIPLEAGHYYFTVSIDLNWTETKELPAGDAYLDTTFTP